MYPKPFEYHSPKTVEEAAALVERYGQEAKVLAGGQSLIPLMKLRLLSPAHVIDLGKVEGLSYIRKEGGELAIGAMTTMVTIVDAEVVRNECPILRDCALVVADAEVRNMGTIGGNVSHADPTNDMPGVMVATGASFVVASTRGRRTIPASEFFVDTFTTAIQEGEILVEARVPLGQRRFGAYLKLERQAGDFGIAGVAAVLDMSPDGTCASCGIGLTAVGPTAIKATKAEKILRGTRLEKERVEEAAKAAAQEAQPVSDLRGSAEYKREMVRVLTVRAVRAAARRRAND
ncbi:MAG: xanthine dehydrogenase family protein subunit M [Nitrososphaerales archaeon]|nr:xanthine dehydrogenase family protein subunit M [Nitrososphaerales archaeon]